MASKFDIMDDAQMKKMPYSVPDGYFDRLQSRLSEIPSDHPIKIQQKNIIWTRLRPYVALVAAFALMVTVGTAVLKLGSKSGMAVEEYDESDYYAELVSRTNLYSIYETSYDALPTNDEIAEFLLNTGVPVEHLLYYENEQ